MGMPCTWRFSRGVCPALRACGFKVKASPGKLPAGAETRSTIEEVTPYLSVHFTNFGETADTYIEKMCATYRHEISRLNRRIIVATSDRIHQLTVVGYGAEWMSAQQLAFDIDSTGTRMRRKQKNTQKSSRGFLASSLDPAAQQRLAQLRFGKH